MMARRSSKPTAERPSRVLVLIYVIICGLSVPLLMSMPFLYRVLPDTGWVALSFGWVSLAVVGIYIWGTYGYLSPRVDWKTPLVLILFIATGFEIVAAYKHAELYPLVISILLSLVAASIAILHFENRRKSP